MVMKVFNDRDTMKLSNAIYLKKRNSVFVYVPKVACTNWKAIMRFMEIDAKDYLDPVLAHDKNKSGLTFLNEVDSVKEILSSTKIKKYTFIRDPFSRILSAYLNKFSNNEHVDYFINLHNEILEYKRVNKLDPEIDGLTFYTFLHWLKYSLSPHVKNEHWLPQSEIIGEDLLLYDYIGRFENIEYDSHKILDMLNCDIRFPTQQDVKFKATEAIEKIKQYYGQKEVALVLDIYEKDFMLLKYSTAIEDYY